MIKRLTRVAPLQCGIVLAVLYGLLSLVFLPLFFLFALIGAHGDPGGLHGIPGGSFLLAAVFIPIMYAVFGFIGGVIAAFIYNLVAGWTGGLEFTTTEAVPPLPARGNLPTTY